ncbi:MAG TPA: hypothetical protein VN541_23270, partial [Tepidisphaeraceae bacterium]|nr:hypothetical protein [Tepidisphaeraceae bacterium]
MLLTYPTRSNPRITLAVVVSLLAGLCAIPTIARGQKPTTEPATQPVSEDSIAKWFSDLNSADTSARHAACAKLMRLKRTQLTELRDVVEKSRPLAPSQASALRRIVEEVYLAGEPYEKDDTHGFLGILMDTAALSVRDLAGTNEPMETPGVVVADRIPGFCASRTLLDGDMILGMANS